MRVGKTTRDLPMNDDYSLIPFEKRKTKTGQASSSEPLLVTRLTEDYSLSLGRRVLFLNTSSLSAADVKKMKDDVFEGKMSLDEYQRKTQNTNLSVNTVFNDLVVRTGVNSAINTADTVTIIR